MSRHVKKIKDEMLIVHHPPSKNMAGGNDANRAARSSGEQKGLAALQAELASAKTADERRAILQSIQEQFGNEVAQDIVHDARIALPPDKSGEKS